MNKACEFNEKLSDEDVDIIRYSLYEMKVLSTQEMEDFNQCQKPRSEKLAWLFSILSKKEDGYDKLIEVLEAKAEGSNNWYGELAEWMKTEHLPASNHSKPAIQLTFTSLHVSMMRYIYNYADYIINLSIYRFVLCLFDAWPVGWHCS